MGTSLRSFAIHGDNIVECERTLHLVRLALADEESSMRGPAGSPTNPSFRFLLNGGRRTFDFVFFPGFGRWNVDIRHMIRDRGGIIREAPDVIVSEVTSGHEDPLIAMEYSGALSAGNQAWQRSGRAYSIGLARIPHLYVAELGGYELDETRARKAPRLPNPAVPFSYVSYSSYLDTPVLPAFVPNPGIDEDAKALFGPVMGEDELVEYIRIAILNEDSQETTEALQEKALTFVQRLASSGRRGRTLTPDQWAKAYQAARSGSKNALISYLLKETSLRWSKKASIKSLTTSASELMRIAGKLSIGLTSSELPMCLIPTGNRRVLAEEIARLHIELSSEFLDWLRNEEPLVICWVMGFKPRGDDARPDRGLPPFTRMLVGPDADMLTVVYGPAPAAHWSLLLENPRDLASRNGLWEAILVTSDAILADSATDNVTTHGLLKAHWEHAGTSTTAESMLVTPRPERIGEHDVDTVIHTIFARLGETQVFEGLCNPPGGDWSGISLLTLDRRTKLRWLSLPRVSGIDAKRPDHVLQLFGLGGKPIILAIESKETANSLETRIGPRLTSYVSSLLESPASIEWDSMTGTWSHSAQLLETQDFQLASATAFLFGYNVNALRATRRAEADLQIGLRFSTDGSHCEIHLFPDTTIGQEIAEFVSALPLDQMDLSAHVHQ